jgi:hypothetical protein
MHWGVETVRSGAGRRSAYDLNQLVRNRHILTGALMTSSSRRSSLRRCWEFNGPVCRSWRIHFNRQVSFGTARATSASLTSKVSRMPPVSATRPSKNTTRECSTTTEKTEKLRPYLWNTAVAEKGLANLGGMAQSQFEPTGLICTFVIPLPHGESRPASASPSISQD